MIIDTKQIITITEANQNFSKVVHTVDESGLAVILKNNKPRYVVVDFDEYNNIVDYANIQLLFDTQDKNVKEYFFEHTELKYKSNRFGIKGATDANMHFYDLNKPKDKVFVKLRNNQTTLSDWDI